MGIVKVTVRVFVGKMKMMYESRMQTEDHWSLKIYMFGDKQEANWFVFIIRY